MLHCMLAVVLAMSVEFTQVIVLTSRFSHKYSFSL